MRKLVPTTAAKYLDEVQGLIIVLSENGTIEFINQYAADLTGYDRCELIGKNWFDQFIPKESRMELKAKFRKFRKAKLKTKEENYIQSKDGELHLIEWHNRLLEGKDGRLIGTFSSGEDVTEKHLLRLYLAEQQVRHRQEKLSSILEASERERQYLAYELHDGVNQVLTTCKLLLESEIGAGNDSGNVQRAFEHIREVINTIRELSHELNPARMGNEGLYESALELVSRVNATGKISVTTDVRGLSYLKELCPQVSLSLYRIMQEALTNTIKHAQAKKVVIRLASTPKGVDLEIEDDGKGFDRKKGRAGIGLKSIYTRAEASGGKAYMVSTPGEGTLLSVHIPFSFPEQKKVNKEEHDL